MSRRVLVLILGIAAVARIIFIVGGATGSFAVADSARHKTYMLKGYAIATGYGMVEVRGTGDVRKHLQQVRSTIHAGEKPEAAEIALQQTDVEFPLTMDHPPGIYLLIAGLYKLLDRPAELPLSILGGTLDLVSTGILCWLVTLTLGVRMGTITGLLYALYPPIVFSSVAKEPDGILPFFLLGMLACIVQGTRAAGPRALAWDVAAGALLGVGSYFRPDFLPVPVVLAVFLALWTRQPLRSLGRMALLQLCALIVLLPWAYRNHEISGKWVFTSSSMGGVLMNGLGAFENPWGYGYGDSVRWNEALEAGLDGPFTPEGDVYFREIFWRSVREQPMGYVGSVLRRLPIAIATPYEVGYRQSKGGDDFAKLRAQGMDRYEVLVKRPMLVLEVYGVPLAMGVLSAICVACCVFMLIVERRHFGLLGLLLCLHAYSIGSHTLVQLHPRYLITTMFCWLIGLAYVIAWALARGKSPIEALELGDAQGGGSS